LGALLAGAILPGMRRAGLVVVVALALTGSSAAATRPPFPGFHTLKSLPVIDLGRAYKQRPASCSAHARQAKGTLRQANRKVLPVACEQPPRSHVRDAGSVIVLAP
jgi:hypothetical protein